MARSVKGLYNLAAQGQLQELTGVGAPYEAPDVILVDEAAYIFKICMNILSCDY
jgi:adenylylsulfate kinase-like enzyme